MLPARDNIFCQIDRENDFKLLRGRVVMETLKTYRGEIQKSEEIED